MAAWVARIYLYLCPPTETALPNIKVRRVIRALQVVVSGFLVQADVEAFDFDIFADPQTYGHIDHFKC